MIEDEVIQKHQEQFKGAVNLRYYMSDLNGDGAEMVSHHMLYLVAGKLIAVYTFGKLGNEIKKVYIER